MFGTSNLVLRFTIVPALVMLLFVGALSTAVEWLVTRQLWAQSSLRVEQRAALLADRLAAAVAVRIGEVELLARSAALAVAQYPPDPRQRDTMRAELEWLRAKGSAFVWIGVAALDGTVLVGTERWLEGQSIAGRPVFEGGQSRVSFADFHPPVALPPWLPATDADDVADIGVPVRDAAGKVIAVVTAHLKAGWFVDVGEKTVTNTETGRLGLNAFILSGSGRPLREAPPFVVTTPAAAPFSVTGSDGHDYIAVVRDVPLPATAGSLRWRVVVTQDSALAALEVRQFQQTLLVFSLAAVLACVALGLVAARRATSPYRHLYGAVQARFNAAGGRAVLPYGAYLDALGDELLRNQAKEQGPDETLFLRQAADVRQFKRVIDQLPMGVAISSADFRVEYLSKGYTRTLGWTTDAVRGPRTAEFLFDPAEAAGFVAQFDSLGSPPGELAARFEALRDDGTRLPVQWHMVPLFDRNDRFEGVVALVQDISG